jgi:transcriptional regulator with XRE-family HTH domain
LGGEDVSAVEEAVRELPTLGRRIHYLIENTRKPDGEKYTFDQVAQGVTRLTGKHMDRRYVSQLVLDRKPNPTRVILQGLAKFFGVSAAVFFDDEQSARIGRQMEVAVALRDPRTRELALRLLQATDPADVSLVAEVVGAIGERPALRQALEVMLSLDEVDLQAAVDVLQSASRARERGASG